MMYETSTILTLFQYFMCTHTSGAELQNLLNEVSKALLLRLHYMEMGLLLCSKLLYFYAPATVVHHPDQILYIYWICFL